MHKLTTNTTIIGEKINFKTSATLNFSEINLNFSFIPLSKPYSTKTIIGDIATTTHRYPTLTISKTIKIAIGTNKANAKNVFITSQNKFHTKESLPGLITKSWYLNIEEYIVTKGHTHHLEFSINCCNVKPFAPEKTSPVYGISQYQEQICWHCSPLLQVYSLLYALTKEQASLSSNKAHVKSPQ
ncbi:hypothetical protein J5751_07060 [bacterium]|nr:hypothetical protein [bacterium]